MQKHLKRVISILMVILMMFSVVPASVFAEDVNGDSSVAPLLHEYDSLDGDTGTMENESTLNEDEIDTSDLAEDDILDNLNITNGTPESEVIVEESALDGVSGEEDVENLADFVYEGDTAEESAVQKTTGSAYETNASDPYITLSSKKITVNTGSSVKVTIGYGGYSGSVYLAYSRSNSNINASWGSWNKSKIPLTVTGMSSGSCNIYIYLKASGTNKTLARTTISVTIKNTVSLSISKTSLDNVYGKTKTVYATVSGANSSMKIAYSIYSGSSVSCSWGSGKNNRFPLNIYGKNAGTSKVKVSVISSTGATLAYKIITVNISKSASISVSPSSFTIAPGEKKTNVISYSGAYGSLHMKYSINNSNVACSWGSWSGNKVNLYTTGKKSGSSTITIYLYNSSDDLLATKYIYATVKENITLSCSVSSLSLTAGNTQKIVWTFSGTSQSVTYSYRVGNSSICSAGWYGTWNGNSHALNVYAKSAGSTTLTVYLKSSSTGSVLASKSISVKVTGTPSVELNCSSVSLKVGSQISVTATAKNMSGAYYLSYETSGTYFSCSWSSNIVNNKATLTLKGTKSGSGYLTVKLLNSSKSEVARKKIPVSVAASENPKVWFSLSNITVTDNSSGSVGVSFSGVNDYIYLTYSLSNSNITAKWGNWSNTTIPLTITGKKIGTSTVTVYLKRYSNDQTLATATMTVYVNANTDEISLLSYRFENYETYIPLSTFNAAFGFNTRAERLYKSYSYSDGVCYGMATTSMLYNLGEVSIFSFSNSAKRIWDLLTTNKNSLLNLTVTSFIELMHITQFSTMWSNTVNSGLNQLCNNVANGNKVLISIYGPQGGHALVGYKLDTLNNRLYVYDCNYPGSKRSIQLSGTKGNYTAWSYDLGSFIWNSSNGSIAYQDYSAIRSQWSNRGNLSVDSGWLDNTNLLMINSNSFEIYDLDDDLIATYSNGILNANTDEIIEIKPMGININAEEDKEEDYNFFYLPTNYYSIKNLDGNVEALKVEMIDEELGVVVDTQADEISFGVDDAFNVCATTIDLEKGEEYDVMLLSSQEGCDDFHVYGIGQEDQVDLGFSVLNGVFSSTNAQGVSMTSLSSSFDNVSIMASATDGGSISPEGKTITTSGKDVSYKIVADEGYELVDLIVNEESVGIVSEYTFVQLEADSTIQAIFEKIDTEDEEKIDDTEDEKTNDTEEPNPDACIKCGEVHTGFFGVIIAFFHRIIYKITHLFG